MDSPDQGAYAIPASEVEAFGDSVRFSVAAVGGEYEGRLSEDGSTLDGIWKQAGMVLDLVMERSDAEALAQPRPQEPEEPLPYVAEDVSFENLEAGNRLAGTLTLPEEPGPHPAVVLISGSGPQDRDETVFGHRPFLILADYLTRRGIAVLRFDDRGVGGSTGDIASATTEDFVGDALAGVAYLKDRSEIDDAKIGLLGHSEGGLVAPLAANRSPDVAFVVLIAGPGLDGGQILELQVETVNRTMGVSEQVIARRVAAQKRIMEVMRTTPDDSAAAAQLHTVFREIGVADEQTIENQIRQLLTPWMRHFITYDPAPALEEVQVPVLAVIGENDVQVPPAENLPAIEAALKAGGNPDFTIQELPGLNHLLQASETGAVTEYAQIEETMSPDALRVIGDWIVERTKAGGG
jgi:pimeloyl-ACP methyl ester carboxylesterase